MDDSKKVELAIFAAQLYRKYLKGNTDTDVEFDVRIRDPDGDLRQVDTVVTSLSGVELFEVQDRSRPLTKPQLGQFIDKLTELGADRLTVVTTSGYAHSTLRRVARSGSVTALILQDPPPAEVELERFVLELDLGGPTELRAQLDVDFESRYLVNAANSETLLKVAFGLAGDEIWEFFAAVTEAPDGWIGLTLVSVRGTHQPPDEKNAELFLRASDGPIRQYATQSLERGPIRLSDDSPER